MMRDEDAKPVADFGVVGLGTGALELMGIGELEGRIELLRAEIAACETMIAAKRAQRDAADALFAKRSD
jgi:uncharacterized small protein (DUF1192 family)